jgi:ABC-2 type transport system permease protein
MRIILITGEMYLKQAATDVFILFTIFVQPLLIALLALYMLRDTDSGKAIFIVVGSALTGLWSGVLFMGGNSITAERWNGTLEPLVAAPAPLVTSVIGKNLANVLQSISSMILSYALAMAFFGYSLEVQQPILFVVSLVLTVASFVAFGLLLSPIFIINPAVQSLQNGLEFPIYILAGFMFPVALLPGWTSPLSAILAPYWAAKALHGSSSGAPLEEVLFAWAMMVVISLVYLGLSVVLFRVMLYRVREDATLGLQ